MSGPRLLGSNLGNAAACLTDPYCDPLWDAASGWLKATLAGHAQGIRALAWSPDGKTLATASSDRTVRLWDLPAGK
ncbi:MAG: hypothetical protein JO112_20715 [Planctomycetes bacterium]|nr:hypothetical protein [Planctomycetota bacterium]